MAEDQDTNKVQVLIRMPEAMKLAIEKHADNQHRTITGQVLLAVEEHLKVAGIDWREPPTPNRSAEEFVRQSKAAKRKQVLETKRGKK